MQEGGPQYGASMEMGHFGGGRGHGLGIAAAAEPTRGGSLEEMAAPAEELAMVAGAEEAERGGSAGNRWPQEETLALLRIRSEMDAAFREATLKGPLWEEVSRKLAHLGYARSAKKCKEKFENVQKYYKRTKDGRAGRQDGKSYRFFRQLEALYGGAKSPTAPAPPPQPTPLNAIPLPTHHSSDDDEDDSSASESNRKRQKMMAFFESLTRQVMERQEAMQNKFLEVIEKREHERMIREEAWRRQELARVAREHEATAQDRAMAATRDATILSFLHKITGHAPPFPPAAPPPAPPPSAPAETSDPASSRWPKPEVHALISLRSGMDTKYQEAGPKAPLWEEIAAGMRRLGYNRSAKRCKEKWENINKYFKKVKDSKKKRPEDAKTCPYFHQLDALYRKKGAGAAGSSSSEQQENAESELKRDDDGGESAGNKRTV
ncbi:trihelix transcription factor DF1-like isoform X2 [Wolffia australiana]